MRRRRLLASLLILPIGCRSPEVDLGDDTAPTPPTPSPTDTSSPTGHIVAASCETFADNALRVSCDVELTAADSLILTLSADGVPTRSFSSYLPAGSGALLGWGLKPDTTYTWDIGDRTGTVTTGSLPADLASATTTVTGTAFGFDAVLQPLFCADVWFVMIDGEGDIIWYEPDDLYGTPMHAYEWSQADRSLLVSNETTLREVHVSGIELLELDDTQVSGTMHHDIGRSGRYTYVLFERLVNGWFVDGIDVFEGETLLGTFALEDHYTVEAVTAPFTSDWSHANGINPTDDGTLVLSLLNFDSVLGIDGDPGSPDFLDIQWLATGTDDGLPGATYSAIVGADEGWDRQHNASRHGDRLWMFDNSGNGATSRAARYVLDDKAGEARLDREWELDLLCPVQGGAIPIDGGVLVSCAGNSDVYAFEEDGTEPIWHLDSDCSGGSFLPEMNRGIPVQVE